MKQLVVVAIALSAFCACVLAEVTLKLKTDCLASFNIIHNGSRIGEGRLMRDGEEYKYFRVLMTEEEQPYVGLIRCDKKNEQGLCYYVITGTSCNGVYGTPDGWSSEWYFPLLTFKYDGIPELALCPDASGYCKKYCTSQDKCIFVDFDNRYIGRNYNEYIQWSNESFDPSIFHGYQCDLTELPKVVNVCPTSTSSSVTSSSASVAKVGASFFAILILLLPVFNNL